MTPENSCPCQSGMTYGECCQPFHAGTRYAPTAEILMRSRYCAYALGQVDYLINTTHRDHPQYKKNTKAWRSDVFAYCKNARFLGLTILSHEPGETESDVTFHARLTYDGKTFTLAEKSHFVKIGQRWLYHSGQSQVVDA